MESQPQNPENFHPCISSESTTLFVKVSSQYGLSGNLFS